MAKYTVELNSLINANFNLGLTDYPLFDEAYRAELNTKIKDHFRFREIGFETPALFTFYLNRTLREVMPLYNQYYNSAKLEYNPLFNMEYSDVYTGKNIGTNGSTVVSTITDITSGSDDVLTDVTDHKTGTNSTLADSATHLEGTGTTTNNLAKNETKTIDSTDTTDDTKWDTYSDTPQGLLAGIDANQYLSNARKIADTKTVGTIANNGAVITDTGTVGVISTEDGTANSGTTDTIDETYIKDGEVHGTNSSNRDIDKTDTLTGEKEENKDYTRIMNGITGVSGSELLLKYRQTFLNIDMMVISELNSLFMTIY